MRNRQFFRYCAIICSGGAVVGGLSLYNPGRKYPINEHNHVTLRDGRKFSYIERGAPTNKNIVFAIHDTGSSRFQFDTFLKIFDKYYNNSYDDDRNVLNKHNIRLICIDRPGYGESTKTDKNRKYIHFAKDINELYQHLCISINENDTNDSDINQTIGLESMVNSRSNVSCISLNSGAMYALSCLYYLPYMNHVTLISPDISDYIIKNYNKHERNNRLSLFNVCLHYCPYLISFFLKMARFSLYMTPNGYLESVLLKYQECNKDTNIFKLKNSDEMVMEMLIRNNKEALRQTSLMSGLVRDLQLQNCKIYNANEFDFLFNQNVDDINMDTQQMESNNGINLDNNNKKKHITIWHGKDDPIVDVNNSVIYSNCLSNATTHLIDNCGNMSLLCENFDDIFCDLQTNVSIAHH